MRRLDSIVGALCASEAQTLVLRAGEPPLWRVRDELVANGDPMPPAERFEDLLRELAEAADLADRFAAGEDLEFTHDSDDGRVRVRVARDSSGRTLVVRRAPEHPTLDALALPDELSATVELPRGLVLLSGAVGAGRTEALAALVSALHARELRYVVALDETTEFTYPGDAALLHQVRVGTDVASYAVGIDAAARAGADVIAVGAVEDTATARAVMRALDRGALVFAALVAHGVTDALDRVATLLPQATYGFERSVFADELRVAAHLRLVAPRRGDPIRLVELAQSTPEVRALLREDRITELDERFTQPHAEGLRQLEVALAECVRTGRLPLEEAYRHARSHALLDRELAP